MRTIAWFAFCFALLAGCGSSPVPTERLVATEASIRSAQEVGVGSNPKAALHLKLAQEGLTKAKALIADGKNEDAERMLLRAQADGELSLALAREAVAIAAAQQALDQIQSLKK